MFRSILAASGSLVLIVGAASAQTTGTISGTITAGADGSPLASALVQVFDANRRELGGVNADASGVYTRTGLTPGTYYLRFSQNGFVPQAYSGIPCAAQSCYTASGGLGVAAAAVTVVAGITTAVNASLDRGGTVAGTVRRASDATAISGIPVLLYDSSTSLVVSMVTSQNGSFSFTGLPFGTYYARTQRNTSALPDYLDTLFGGALCPSQTTDTPRCRLDSGMPIAISAGAPSATADFSLPQGYAIIGGVTDAATGTPIVGLKVAAYIGATQIAVATTTGSGGYAISGLDPGTYFVRTLADPGSTLVDQWYRGACVACAGAKPAGVLVSERLKNSIDFALSSSTAGISGTLTLPGLTTNVSIPLIEVFNADGVLVKTALGPSTPVTTPPAGNLFTWSVTGLPPGTYYVRTFGQTVVQTPFFAPKLPSGGYWIDELYDNAVCVAADCLPTSGTPVVVSDGTVTTGVTFALQFGAQLFGTGVSGAQQTPFFPPNPTLEVFDSRGVLLPGRASLTVANFLVAGLPAGTYFLLLQNPVGAAASVLYPGTACDGCSITSGTPIVVGAGDQKVVNFTFPFGRAISGTVRSDSTGAPPNQPLSTISVEAYAPNGHLMATSVTRADGTYSLFALPAGSYFVRTRNTRGLVDQVYSGQTCGRCDPLGGTPVDASQTDVTGIDFALPRGQTITGQVVAAGGGPLAGVGVLAYASTPASPAAHVTTDAFGGYLATAPAGSYFVQTESVAGYAQQIFNRVACPQGVCPTGSATPVPFDSSPTTIINLSLPVCTSGAIAPVRLATAAVGASYRQTLVPSGITGSVTFLVSSGTLPPGLTLDSSTGVVSGTPTASGQFTFTAGTVDASGCAASRSYTLDVPACTYADIGPISVAASGDTDMVGFGDYTCATLPQPTTDVSWVTANFSTFDRFTPLATLHVLELGYSVQANPSRTARTGHIIAGPRSITVFQSGTTTSPPFGSVDAPADGVVTSGSIGISGWALDDLGVTRVSIYRDPVAGEPAQLIFVGLATFVTGARPDVVTAFPTAPFNDRAGWGYLLLTNMLPNRGNGTFRFSVFAEDADGNRTLIGTKVINAVNSSSTTPFGGIDTPDQGGTTSGTGFINFGWALTPQPKLIPFDGSTIRVLIDGVDVGSVTGYNFFRSDVSGLFPGLNNSAGPIGYRMIDTTALSEGLHTIVWVATDDGGQTTGIGSRYFTVNNSAWRPSLRATSLATPQPPSMIAIPARVNGVDLGRKAASLASLPLGDSGSRTVTMSNLQSLQLSLAAESDDAVHDKGASDPAYDEAGSAVGRVFRLDGTEGCASTYTGYLVVNGELRSLPIGSSLDPVGTFYWHPGTVYFGTYSLLFIRTACDGTQQRISVTVSIR